VNPAVRCFAVEPTGAAVYSPGKLPCGQITASKEAVTPCGIFLSYRDSEWTVICR